MALERKRNYRNCFPFSYTPCWRYNACNA